MALWAISLQLRSAERIFAEEGMLGRLQETIQSSRDRVDKLSDMIGNDRFGRRDLLPSECERLFRDRAYKVDVVKINAFQFIYAGIDVPWHGDIDDKERTIQALPQHRCEYLGCQQRRLRRC